jgi:hypothetical protein
MCTVQLAQQYTKEFYLLGYNAMKSTERQLMFQRTCCLYLHGQRISQVRNQCGKQSLALFFKPEDGSGMFLQNVG